MTRCIKYWLKLQYMDDDRLPKNCYNMLRKLTEAGRNTWCSEIKKLLFRYGFGIVWFEHGVADVVLFLSQFKQRIKDCCEQEWRIRINDSSKLDTYALFKSLLDVEKYLTNVYYRPHRMALTRLRCSSHCLNIEQGRREGLDRSDRLCKWCLINEGKSCIENEFHFVTECKLYEQMRSSLLPVYITTKCQDSFIRLMRSTNAREQCYFAEYICEAFKKRDKFLSPSE